MNFRDVLKKINDVVRPPHVGPVQPTDVTERGGTEYSSPSIVPSQQDKGPRH